MLPELNTFPLESHTQLKEGDVIRNAYGEDLTVLAVGPGDDRNARLTVAYAPHHDRVFYPHNRNYPYGYNITLVPAYDPDEDDQ